MHQYIELFHNSVQEIALKLQNDSDAVIVQKIYKNTSNITGSDPYWFHKCNFKLI